MKIAHIIEAAGGGSGQVVLDLLYSNIQQGYETTLIFSPERADSFFLEEVEKLRQHIRVIATPMQRKISLRDARDGWRLWRVLRRNGPFDIIHSHSSKAGALARIAGVLLPAQAHIYSSHAFITMAPHTPRYYGWMERGLSWLCDYVQCSSLQEIAHAQHDLHIPARKLALVYNGIRLEHPATRESARGRMGLGEESVVLGFAGRLVAQKNIFRLLDAFSIALSRNPGLELAIVGDGELKSALHQSILLRNMKNKVHVYSGYNARDLMAGFDCMICSSDYESFGLVIIEALAAGVPVISHKVGIAEEAITDSESGYLVDFTPSAIAHAITHWLELSPHAKKAMTRRAREAARPFSREHMQQQMNALYQQALSPRHA